MSGVRIPPCPPHKMTYHRKQVGLFSYFQYSSQIRVRYLRLWTEARVPAKGSSTLKRWRNKALLYLLVQVKQSQFSSIGESSAAKTRFFRFNFLSATQTEPWRPL